MSEHRYRHELVERRKHLGLGQEDVAHFLEVRVATVSSWENGLTAPRPKVRPKLAEVLQVSLLELDRLLGIAAPNELNGHRIAEGLSLYEGLVLEAGRIDVFWRTNIHGLLQIEDYATGVEQALPGTNPEQVAKGVADRLARQSVLYREPDPLVLNLVMHESALRDVIGGRALMAAQLDYLVKMAALANVRIRVVPADGRSIFCSGEFELITKRGEIDPFVAVAADPIGRTDCRNWGIEAYAQRFADLVDIALPPDQSISFIRKLRETTYR